MRNKPFVWLLVFYTGYMVMTKFSNTLLPTYYLKQGLALDQILISTAVAYVGHMLMVSVARNLNAKAAWTVGLLFYALYLLLLMRVHNGPTLFIASFVSGFGLHFFFTFYNIAHFRQTPEGKGGVSAGLMFAIPPVVSIGIPLLAGYLAQISYGILWAVAGFCFLAEMVIVQYQANFAVSYSLRESLRLVKPVRIFIFLEAVWEAVIMGVIQVYTLFFLKTPLGYGAFASYLALLGALAGLLLGRFSDKRKRRAIYLFPVTIIIGILTLLLPLGLKSLPIWAVVTGAIQFMVPLFWGLTMNLLTDNVPNLSQAFPARELLLSAGRILGLVVAFVLFRFTSHANWMFVFFAAIMFLFTVVLYWRKYRSRAYQYV